ncbi:IclR family transcriptional regulator [Streptomyces zingiberis]|uniref:IclR family transcriptional regulator n=1 Tax=Streptomyces zingiberis TaxID=2053010 RepID=A0ABX1C3F1_9ACTN|nr:IclR family transcriptional regulator [Streptomyces zingiberis]NJQ03200.1 IclR family transcriptional regulator [Streptomyces zingiberis]
MPNHSSDPYGATSAANTLRTLLFLRDRGAVRVTELSGHLGVAASTAHRLLSTLRAHGFAEQETGGKRYRPGPALLGLRAGVDEDTLRRTARPHLEQLRDATGETANLLVPHGPDVYFLDGVEGPHPLRVSPRTGDHVPAHATAAGKALLWDLPPEAVRERCAAGLAALTETTLTDLGAFLADLEESRGRGYALNAGESVTGVHATGVPVHDRSGRCVAAVTLSAPATRLDHARAAELAPLMRRTAGRITAGLG